MFVLLAAIFQIDMFCISCFHCQYFVLFFREKTLQEKYSCANVHIHGLIAITHIYQRLNNIQNLESDIVNGLYEYIRMCQIAYDMLLNVFFT